MIHILLADDHPIVREGLRAVLETQPDFEVVGTPQQAASGDEALRLALELRPDILLLDLEMPVMDGVETLLRLRQQSVANTKIEGQQVSPRVIVFTAFDSDERIFSALAAGANGYVLKGAPREEIFQAIRVAMQGGSLLQPLVASKLLHRIGKQGRLQSQPLYEALTERELEVLTLLAQGMPNKEIAAQLVISERTAKFHVSSIMGKLGATNRTEAVALAAQKGLITLRA